MSDSEISHPPSAVRHGVPHEAIHARFAVAMLRARLHEQNRASRHQSCGGASVCMASSYVPGVLTTSFMSKRLTPLNGFGTLSILPVPVALA